MGQRTKGRRDISYTANNISIKVERKMRQDIEKLGSFFNISPFFILLPHRMFAVTLKKKFPETSKEVMQA